MDTLAEFERACDEAYWQLFITWEERQKALSDYKQRLRDLRVTPQEPTDE